MRLFLVLAFTVALGLNGARADEPQAREDIVLTGGCALRFMEHGKGAVSHDVYWFNFVDASVIRLQQLKQEHSGDILTWLVYKPAYARRSEEMGLDLLAQLQEKAKSVGARLVFFSSKEELIAYLNKGFDRDKVKIADFDYIGHSNKACFLFDYSNYIDTMSVAWLHVKDLGKIHGDIFTRDATCKSWGCHCGEMYSKWWKSHFDVPMIGAVGKTDFAHGGLPELSDSTCEWVE
jgi:hypothetical protein